MDTINVEMVAFYISIFVISMITALAITIIIIIRMSGTPEPEESRIDLKEWHKSNMDHNGHERE